MPSAREDDTANERGQVIVLFALSLVVLVGLVAVILDGGRVYTERRRAQNAADAAATAGAAVLDKSNIPGTLAAIGAAACQAAANNGFGSGSYTSTGGTCGPQGSAVKIHVPGSGDAAGQLSGVLDQFEADGYVQVAVTSDFQPFVAGIFGYKTFGASALAVAVNIPGSGIGYTLLVLDPVDCGAFQINGTTTALAVNGGVQVNSDAFHTKGSTTLCSSQNAATVAGGASLTTTNGPNNVVGNGDPTVNPAWTAGADYVPDPLGNVHVPDPLTEPARWTWIPGQPGSQYGPQTWTNSKKNPFPDATTGKSLPPGVIYGGITVGTGDDLILQGGTYIMAGGGFNVSGGTVSAKGPVTIIYTTDPWCNSSNSGSCTTSGLKLNGDLPSGTGQSTGGSGGTWGLAPGTGTGPLQAPGEGCTSYSPPTGCTTAPNTDDPYLNGILMYVDRNVPQCIGSGNTILDVGGNGSFYFDTGSIIYAPCSTVKLYGNGPNQGGAVVSYQVRVSGTKTLNLGGPGLSGAPKAKSGLVQ